MAFGFEFSNSKPFEQLVTSHAMQKLILVARAR